MRRVVGHIQLVQLYSLHVMLVRIAGVLIRAPYPYPEMTVIADILRRVAWNPWVVRGYGDRPGLVATTNRNTITRMLRDFIIVNTVVVAAHLYPSNTIVVGVRYGATVEGTRRWGSPIIPIYRVTSH